MRRQKGTHVKPGSIEALYLDLLKRSLTGFNGGNNYSLIVPLGTNRVQRALFTPVRRLLRVAGLDLIRRTSAGQRTAGRDWPMEGITMVGIARLDNLQECIEDVVLNHVPGDLLEAGVWRGGAAIFMRAVLAVLRDRQRIVWAADSFQGLPPPEVESHPADAGDLHHDVDALAVSLDEVKANFARYGLLDDQVSFLPGWFRDSLPGAPVDRLALVRLDGDLYDSTMLGLRYLYPKLSIGGYLIVDDYGNDRLGCRQAVDDFRAENNITDSIASIDWTGAYWKRSA